MAAAPESSGFIGALSRRIFGENDRDPQSYEQNEAGLKAGQQDGGAEAIASLGGSPQPTTSTPSPGEKSRLESETSPASGGMLSHPVEISPSNTGTPFSSAANSPTGPHEGFNTPQARSPGVDLAPLSLKDALESSPEPSPGTAQQGTPTPSEGIEIGKRVPAVRTRLESPMMAASPTTNIVDQLMGEVVRGRLSKDSENSSRPQSRRELDLSQELEGAASQPGEQKAPALALGAQGRLSGAQSDASGATSDLDSPGKIASRKRSREAEATSPRPVTPKLSQLSPSHARLESDQASAQPTQVLASDNGASTSGNVVELAAKVPAQRQVEIGQEAAEDALAQSGSPHPVGAYSSTVAVKPTTGEPGDLNSILSFGGHEKGSAVAAAPEATIKSEAAGLLASGLAIGTPAKEDFLGRINGNAAEDLGEAPAAIGRQSVAGEGAVDSGNLVPGGGGAQGDEREPLESVKREVTQAAAAPAIANIHDNGTSTAGVTPAPQALNGQLALNAPFQTTTTHSSVAKESSTSTSTTTINYGGPAPAQEALNHPAPDTAQQFAHPTTAAKLDLQGGAPASAPVPGRIHREIEPQTAVQSQAVQQQEAPVLADGGTNEGGQRKGFLCCFGG